MARAKKQETETEDTGPTETTRKVITAGKLKSLLASAKRATSDISEISGTLGEEIKSAAEKHHLNRRVFGMIRRFDRLPPEKLAIDLEDLEHYIDVSGLRARAESAPRMTFDEAGEGDDEDEGNVRKFPQPDGIAAE